MKQNIVLDLPLKKKWYEMIESGIKKEEYREIKPYWCNRLLFMYPFITQYWEGILERVKKGEIDFDEILLEHGTRHYTHVRFRYGYTKRTMLFELKGITIGKGKTEWGAAADKDYYILTIKKIRYMEGNVQ